MPEIFNSNFKSLVIKDKNIFHMTVISLIYLLSWALVSPYITVRIHTIANNFLFTGILIALYYLIRLIFDIPLSNFVEKKNTKKVLESFFILAILVPLGYVFINTTLQLVILRIFHGFAAAGLWISFWTYTREIRSKKHIKAEQAEIILVDYLSDFVLVIGPLVGGFLMSFYSWTYGFILASVGMLIGLLLTLSKIKPIKSPVKTLIPFKEEFRNFTLFKKVSTLPILVIFFFGMGSVFWVFLPIILYLSGFAIFHIGITMTLMYATGLLMEETVREQVKKLGSRKTLLISILLQAFSFWLISKTLFPPSVYLAGLTVGLGWLYFKQASDYYFSKSLKTQMKNTIDGSLRIFLELGAFIILPIIGYALNILSISSVFYYLALANILTIVLICPLKSTLKI